MEVFVPFFLARKFAELIMVVLVYTLAQYAEYSENWIHAESILYASISEQRGEYIHVILGEY